MPKSINKVIEYLTDEYALDEDLSDMKFVNNGGRVHNWENYVPQELQNVWTDLTQRERVIIITMAEIQARNEDWY